MKGWKEALYPQFQKWVEKGSLYIISDTHFGEQNGFQFLTYDGKVSNFIEQIPDEKIVSIINSTIHKNDTLIILGDVGNIEPIKKLNGYKVLITGNHDAGASNYKLETKEETFYYKDWIDMKAFNQEALDARMKGEAYFDAHWDQIKNKYESEGRNKLFNTLKTNPDFVNLTSGEYEHRLPVWKAHYSNRLFNEVYDGPIFISPRILLSHEQIAVNFGLNIHGHTHACKTLTKISGSNGHSKKMNVCAGLLTWKPINLGEKIDEGILHDIDSVHDLTLRQINKTKKRKEKKANEQNNGKSI